MLAFFCEKLKQLRKAHDLTQDQVAEIFHVSSQSVSRWETGANFPDIELLPHIASFFKVTVDELLGTEIIIGEQKANEYMRDIRYLLNSGKLHEGIETARRAVKEIPANYAFRESNRRFGMKQCQVRSKKAIVDAPTALGVTVGQVLSAIEGNVSGPIHTLELGDGRYVTKKVFSGIPRRRMFAYHSSEGISTILFAINENAQPVPLQATQLNYNDVLSLLPDDVTRFATIGSSTFDGRLIYFISVEHDADFDFASLEVSLDE